MAYPMEREQASGHLYMTREHEWAEAVIPKRFQTATFDTYQANKHNKQLLKVTKEWAEGYTPGESDGLVLGGTIGTGKTHLLYSIGRTLASRGIWPIYRNFASVCIELKDGWRNKESGQNLKSRMGKAQILMLDDLGAEMQERSEQGWISEFVYDLVETRYNEMLPTIIATNLNMASIGNRYGDRVASRLVEMCRCLWVEGYDYRLNKRRRVG